MRQIVEGQKVGYELERDVIRARCRPAIFRRPDLGFCFPLTTDVLAVESKTSTRPGNFPGLFRSRDPDLDHS